MLNAVNAGKLKYDDNRTITFNSISKVSLGFTTMQNLHYDALW